MPAVPVCEAQGSGEGGCFDVVEQREQMNMGIGIGRDISVGQMREARSTSFKAEKQLRFAGDRLPAELAALVEKGGTIAPN